ncbi:hypothetical protein [Paenibacillus glycanilyticus]|uniref:hypothetical protein n=1 Tax=Paenibacillus glycanilyticus TaxID=126569 RepID=UPI0019106CB7|nr:hypothetical protein [Paenibacillus glycanilyticus]
MLLAKAAGAYPNKAPDFRRNPQIFEIWVERLANVDAATGLANLDRHIDSSNFFPDIADIVRHDPQINLLQQETEDRFLLLARWEQSATRMPLHLKRGVGD